MTRWKLGGFLVFCLMVMGCHSSTPSPAISSVIEGEVATLTVTSSVFRDGDTIPKKNTCDGEDASPDLSWSDIPYGAKSLALIADDPDAPSGTWVHWVMFNIPPDRKGLPEGVAQTPTLAGVGVQGRNNSGKTGYNGPCPPKGNPHRYFFKLYALDILLDLEPATTKADVEQAMRGHILAQGQLIGKYGR